jgi:hypothetical protein
MIINYDRLTFVIQTTGGKLISNIIGKPKQNPPKFKQGFSSEHGSDEHAIVSQDPTHLAEKSGQVVNPVCRQRTKKLKILLPRR